jgi:hypothetical protein
MLNGRCFCGAVEYTVEDAFLYAAYCHCSRCRQHTGSAFSASGGIEADKLVVSRRDDPGSRPAITMTHVRAGVRPVISSR